METYTTKFEIYTKDGYMKLGTIKGLDSDSINIRIKDLVVSSPEEIDELATELKKCLALYLKAI